MAFQLQIQVFFYSLACIWPRCAGGWTQAGCAAICHWVVSAAVDINCLVLFNNITRQTNMRVNLFQGLGSAKDWTPALSSCCAARCFSGTDPGEIAVLVGRVTFPCRLFESHCTGSRSGDRLWWPPALEKQGSSLLGWLFPGHWGQIYSVSGSALITQVLLGMQRGQNDPLALATVPKKEQKSCTACSQPSWRLHRGSLMPFPCHIVSHEYLPKNAWCKK